VGAVPVPGEPGERWRKRARHQARSCSTGAGAPWAAGAAPRTWLSCRSPLGTVDGSLRVTVQGEVIEQSFGEENLCFRTLQRFTAGEHRMLWVGLQ